jgi:hypothetical protein
MFKDDGAERTNIHTDLTVVAAITHLQGRVKQEQGILPANGHTRTADVADFRLDGNHEMTPLSTVYTSCQLVDDEKGEGA